MAWIVERASALESHRGLDWISIAKPDGTARESLLAVMNRRDEITARLADADPAVKEKLGALYTEFFRLATL